MRANRHDASSDHEGIYESFSDMVLCTVIVLITLVVVLALNVVEQLNVYIEPNHFSGGATRPWLYIQTQDVDYGKTVSRELATERAVYGGEPFVMVNLFSPSSAQSATKVEDGQIVSTKAGQSFHGQYDLSVYNFLQLASGIDPGSFPVDGDQTPLLLPKFSHKEILLDQNEKTGYYTKPDSELALKTMAMAWPVFNNKIYSSRATQDYVNSRMRIYIEVLETDDDAHRIMIGHSVFTLPDDVENGKLGWLAGFSSGLTEMVYLGKVWSKPDEQTNKRIDFFEQNGFEDAAEDYKQFSFPGALTESQEKLSLKVARVNPDISENELEEYARAAEAQIEISVAIVDELSANKFLPPLLRHPKAWQAYINYCIKSGIGSTPPEWLMSEFLEPLGFDQAVVRGLREDG